MKIKTILCVLAIVALSACTQRTCPTYAQNDVDTSEEVKAENA